MPDFPVTFTTYADGSTDRHFSDDWWSWVKTQPQDAMLLWLRSSNWDNVSERHFVELIDNPDTDPAIIAVIFWGTAGWINEPGHLPGKIIGNLEKGYYRKPELWLDRNQFIDKAMVFARLLREAGARNFSYPFPRQLLGPFGARKASAPSNHGKQVEAQIRLAGEEIDVTFHRSEDDYRANRPAMTFRNETLAQAEARLVSLQQPLPDNPVSAFADLSDLGYIERHFLPLETYEDFRRDPHEHKRPHASQDKTNKPVSPSPYRRNERTSIFATVSAVAAGGYLILALILWLTGAFSKSPASHFGAVFALSVMAVIILGGLAVLWRELNK